MRPDTSGFPSHHPLPEFMRGKEPATAIGAAKHPKRAFFNDYCAPGFYLITATTRCGSPRLSEIPPSTRPRKLLWNTRAITAAR